MQSKSYSQIKRLAALVVLAAFFSTGLAALPAVSAVPAPASVNGAINSSVNVAVTVTPSVTQVGGTFNIAMTLDAGGSGAVYLKAVVTQPDGTQHFAWYNFTTTSGTLTQIFPSGVSQTETAGSVSAFFPAASTSEIGAYTLTILNYNMTTLKSTPVASTEFYVENGIKVIVTTNATTSSNAAPRGGSILITANAAYLSNSAPVISSKAIATAILSPTANPSQSYTVTLTNQGNGQFSGTFNVPYNAYSGSYEVVAEVSDGMGNMGSNSTLAYVKPITLAVTAKVNGTAFQRTQTVQITATVTGAQGKPVTSSNGTATATLYTVVNGAINTATSQTVTLTYSSGQWVGTWSIPYNYPTGTYAFLVNASDDLVKPDTGSANTSSFVINPAQIKVSLTATPSSGVRGTTFSFSATAWWPNGQPFTSESFGTDAGSITLYNNVTAKGSLSIKAILLTYDSTTGTWTASVPSYWNTTTGVYSFFAFAHDSFGNSGTSTNAYVTVQPIMLTIVPWGEEVINSNSSSATLYINFNVTYPSNVVSTAGGNLGYIPFKQIPNHIDAYILVNGKIVRNGYDWYYNWSLSTKGTAVYSLYTVVNAAQFSSWYNSTGSSAGVTNTAASGAVEGWPISANMGLGNYTIEVSYFSDNASAPNTGSGTNSFPVAKVLTQPLPNVQQSVGASLPLAVNVYTGGTWGTPSVNSALLPTSVVVHLWEQYPQNHAHIYTIDLSLTNPAAALYSGSLLVDQAPNPGTTPGMFAGLYYANEVLTFSNKFVLPTVIDSSAAYTKVTGDVVFHLTRPFITANTTALTYRPNVWYSVNGTVTDNYGHPVSGLYLVFNQANLSEYQDLMTTADGAIVPQPDTGYVLIIPADAPNGIYPFNFTIQTGAANSVNSFYTWLTGVSPTYYFKVEKAVVVPTIAVSASVSPSSLTNGSSAEIIADVSSNGQPLAGALVQATITMPNGTATISLSPSSTAGVYTAPISISSMGPAGLYTVAVNASKAGYASGSGVTSFSVKVVTPVVVSKPLALALSVSPSSIANGTSGVISATVTYNGQPVSGATVTGTLVSPSGTTTSLLFTTSSTTPGLYTATVNIPPSGPAGTWSATVSASAPGYESASSGIAFTVTMVKPTVIPKPAPVNLTYVYLLAGLAAIFALIALIYIAIKLK
ncbi:FixH family protein [Tardisphaera miroshnichenkoae]